MDKDVPGFIKKLIATEVIRTSISVSGTLLTIPETFGFLKKIPKLRFWFFRFRLPATADEDEILRKTFFSSAVGSTLVQTIGTTVF